MALRDFLDSIAGGVYGMKQTSRCGMVRRRCRSAQVLRKTTAGLLQLAEQLRPITTRFIIGEPVFKFGQSGKHQ
jgi:hypothetical protein